MERQFFSGSTVEQAVLAAARYYGLEPERIAYRLRDKKHGFLNVRRRVVIEVDPSAPEVPEAKTSEMLTAASSERTKVQGQEDPIEEAHSRNIAGSSRWQGEATQWAEDERREGGAAAWQEAIQRLTALVDRSLHASVSRADDGYEINLTGSNSVVLTGGEGRVLDALEHLLPRLVRSLVGESEPCRVDCDGYREQRIAELSQLAEATAKRVFQTSRMELLEPMTPAERRLVHLALADEPTVRTESEGRGFLKRVRIEPA